MSNQPVNIPSRGKVNVKINGVNVTESWNYNDLKNRPLINGTLLEGDVSLQDLGILNISSYNDLDDKPSINGFQLQGNVPLSDLGINNVASLIFTEVT